VLTGATAIGGSALLSGLVRPAWAQDGVEVTIADIGVGDPRGDWSRFTEATGHSVNLVAIGNAPSAVVNQLLAGGGRETFDIIHIVGGMQRPLAEADLIEEIDTSRLPNWASNSYIDEYLAPGTPGFEFIGFDGTTYGVPTILQADSFAYLPDETGELDSYGALFDPRFRGLVALEDNYTTAGQKTALYLKHSGQAEMS
jgi:spermidine/putrescine-binding protein